VVTWGLLLLGVLHFWFGLAYSRSRQAAVGSADRNSLLLRRSVFAGTPSGRVGHDNGSTWHLSANQRHHRTHRKLQRPWSSRCRMVVDRWCHFARSCIDDLVSSAIKRDVGHWNSHRYIHSLQRYFAPVAIARSSSGNQFDLSGDEFLRSKQ
jgi:hypothetical protein